ncbi:transcriptional regulator [Branchiibius hedensis]|uniref:Transcriptional regulator n=1 Tax=Branchiibius hedensis TaxID=672460 RepID=A0A2Y8ZUH2_9MICO|nr:transcriptional regulator [Branchiibius hedensis]SSA33949.1 transcriptional regulator [Branchiibius hedensis]
MKTERLLNLVICLLYTRRPLSKARIREAVPQYAQTVSDEAFDRMFERDKDELRELGIPLRTEPLDALFDDEPGYRIDQRDYALPQIAFEPDELAVLGLASRTWQQASLAGPAASALRKLEASDVERDAASIIGLEPRVRTSEPAFAPIKDAVLDQVAVRFTYRRPGGAATERTIQPWSVVNHLGRWYVTGFDQDRQAARVFRLSRIEGAVRRTGKPGGYQIPAHDAIAMISGTDGPQVTGRARVLAQPGSAHALRRRAVASRDDPSGWTELTLEYGDAESLAEEIAGFGPVVRVLEPPEVVQGVVRRLRAALDANQEGA